MSQVAVGVGVGGRLEPNDDGVELGQGADERVVDVEVDNDSGDGEREGDVDGVGPADEKPS